MGDQHPTERLRLGDVAPNWPGIVAELHKVAPTYGPLALRRGIAELLVDVAREMTRDDAPPSLIDRAQELLDALRRMEWAGGQAGTEVEP